MMQDDGFWSAVVQEYMPVSGAPRQGFVSPGSAQPQGFMDRYFSDDPASIKRNQNLVSALDGLGQSFEGLGGYAQPRTRPYGGAQFQMPTVGLGIQALIAQILRGA